MEFFENFLEVLKTLWQEKVEYILIEGFAVIIHGMPRVTQDLEYETITVEGIQVRIASIETLYWLKKDTLRLEDRRDAVFLDSLIRRKPKK